jgi:DNA-binding response OmpR family regulator
MTAPDPQSVLYIEDDPDIREVAVLALELIGGLTVRAYGAGLEALSATDDFSPDVLLLDVMMPGMDGPSTLLELRRDSRFATAPVIFFTAKTAPAETRRLLDLGAIGVVAKPFDPTVLADDIRRIWRSPYAE